MKPQLRYFLPGVTLTENAPGQLTLQKGDLRLTIGSVSEGMKAAFNLLVADGADEDTLKRQVEGGHFTETLRLQRYLRQFTEMGIVGQQLYADETLLVTAIPTSPYFRPHPVKAGSRYVLSRFACIRRDGSEIIIESAVEDAPVVLHDWRAFALLGLLEAGDDAVELVSAEVATAFYDLLASMGMLTVLTSNGTAEKQSSAEQWSLHDLLFQSSVARGLRETQSPNGSIEAPPIVKPPMSDDVISLAVVDIDQLKLGDMPFTWVLEERRSIRHYGEKPLTIDQLGEFLYRSARVKETIKDGPYAASRRPYPGAGALYPLELYVLAGRCTGLAAGLYHYAPQEHQLEKLQVDPHDQTLLGQYAMNSTGGQVDDLQVLVIIAARYPRIHWKYGATALSLILEDVGVLQQTFYLVATAMSLAPCAVGIVDSQHFAAAADLDLHEEIAIGQLLLGSK